MAPNGVSDQPIATDAEATKTPDTPHFRVQLKAKAPDESELLVLSDIDVVRFQGDDGLTRIVSRAFSEREAAVAFQKAMEARVGAFLTAHGQENTPCIDTKSGGRTAAI